MNLELTEKEVELILNERKEKAIYKKKLRFRKFMFRLCSEWCEWSELEGLSLTMSVFISDFGAEDRIPHEFSNELDFVFSQLKKALSSMDEVINNKNFGV